jgi:AI-2 transport protein TqsA
VIHNIIGNVIEPKVLGRALGLSPLVVMLSIVFWGWLLGPVGALLSVPLTMVVKIVLANTEDLRWAAVLLGPGDGREEAEYAEERRRSRSIPAVRAPAE